MKTFIISLLKYLLELFIISIVFISPKITLSQPSTPNPDMWVTNGSVNAIAVDGDYTYIVGNFTYVGPKTGCGAKLTTTSHQPNMSFPKVNGYIYTSISDGSGGWYIGGSFTKVGSYTRNYIVHINSDGTVDANWNPNANNTVYAIAISGSDIYVGGYFTSIGGQTRNYIAKLNNTDGTVDPNWNPNANDWVRTIAISGSDIYVGGNFTSIGGQQRNRIAKLNNTDGTVDPNWNPNANSVVRTIAISGSDMYVGGGFTSIGGQTRNYIAKLNNSDGTADPNWNPNANDWVLTIAISGSDIYVGGGFTTIGGQPRNRIAKLNNTNGNADATWNPNADNNVLTIAISGSDIYVGGWFTSIGGNDQPYFALFTDRLLPVELTTFSAQLTDGKVLLNWQTETEVNNYGFDIERSVILSPSKDDTWQKIGFVKGNGNSNSPKHYSFVDQNPISGKLKYRLKQIDSDGSFSYSNEIEVDINIPKVFALEQNYPNPFNPTTTISFTLEQDGLTTLKIYDLLGREVQTLVNEELKAGQIHRINFDGSGLASGVYFYKLESKSMSMIKKFVLMK